MSPALPDTTAAPVTKFILIVGHLWRRRAHLQKKHPFTMFAHAAVLR